MILKLLPAVGVEINSIRVVSTQFTKRFEDSFVHSLQSYVNRMRIRMRIVKTMLLLTTYEIDFSSLVVVVAYLERIRDGVHSHVQIINIF